MVATETPSSAPSDLAVARATLADEWRGCDPRTPEQIAAFYRDSLALPDELRAWHERPERQLWTRAVVAALTRATHSTTVLDVGCGLGHDLAALRTAGLDAAGLVGVEPNERMREAVRRDGFAAFPSVAALPAGPPVDAVVCLDVLEHVPDPEALLAELLPRLRPGGLLVEATATHDQDTPLHLPALVGWSPGRFLDRHGFVVREQVDRLRVWQRVTERRPDVPDLLLCAYRSLTVETHECVTRLVQRGWRMSIHRGDALISRVRSIALSRWLRETDGDVFLMVDDDIIFHPEHAEAVVQLARETEAIACGAYPVRGGTHLACRTEGPDAAFGPDVAPYEIRWAGTGFMAVHRKVAAAVAQTMPLCHTDTTWPMWPVFQPFPIQADGTWQYLSEDWAFCARARELGFGVWLEPRVMLGHLGQQVFSVDKMLGAELGGAIPDGYARIPATDSVS